MLLRARQRFELDHGPTFTPRLRAGVMSALGQKQTYAVQKDMSALHPRVDMCGGEIRDELSGSSDLLRRIVAPPRVAALDQDLTSGDARAVDPPLAAQSDRNRMPLRIIGISRS
jgi:hypothetical protein